MEIDQWGESPFDEPVLKLSESDPESVAALAGARWQHGAGGGGSIVVPVLSGEVAVGFPGVTVSTPPGLDSFSLKLLTVLYLSKTDGTMPSGRWVAYRELPDGRFYEPVVNRSIEQPLADAFGALEPGRFGEACLGLGGQAVDFGDASFSFALFPKVLVCFILWFADKEFPARAQALFDSACRNHLNAFDLRMGAQEISSRLIRSL